ncbi:TetR/AcrR family transcriptional regulator [Gordonia sp. (in: high G+C Gram-positive bacteria)]|uniref:TetR/AcrR family transcriptional regulator n=1 Tax=Gordonia sp. (in: high G+C Gram-positive bacteria) TaxID=84139 RepID=UPI003F991C01
MTVARSQRRDLVADTGVRIISRDGMRALTHRAVDREAGLPQGSTSHYAATRDALIDLIANRLATRSEAEVEELTQAITTRIGHGSFEPQDVSELIAELIETLATRGDDIKARLTLLMETTEDQELHARLTTNSTVHAVAQQVSTFALNAAGVSTSELEVEGLIMLTDSLLLHRIAIGTTSNTQPILEAYIRGITEESLPTNPSGSRSVDHT